MPIQIIREDITKIKVDAIVNPTDELFSGKGGVDKQIQDLAGPELKVYCLNLKTPLNVGSAIITGAYKLKNAKYIIHTTGPIYRDGKSNEKKYLTKCYENILKLAMANNIKSIAIPLISTGSFGYPKKEALRIALGVINDFLLDNDIAIYLLVYDKEAYELSSRIYEYVENKLKDNIEDRNRIEELLYRNRRSRYTSLEDFQNISTESFSDCLIRMMKDKGLTDPQVYKRAQISKQAFNKIINKNSIPKKKNVLAIAIAMQLNIDDTQELLEKAEYSFGVSEQDRAIIHFMEHEDYESITLQSIDMWLKKMNIKQIHSD